MRYIDADKLIDKYERAIKDGWNKKTSPISWADAYDCVIADIDDQPTADVVEVVRCKDCKHFTEGMIGDDLEYFCKLTSGMVNPAPDFYCSYGERKDNAN